MGRLSIIIILSFILVSGITFIAINESDVRSSNITSNQAVFTEVNLSATDVIDYGVRGYLNNDINMDEEVTLPWGNSSGTIVVSEDENSPYSVSPYHPLRHDSLEIDATAQLHDTTQRITASLLLEITDPYNFHNPLHIMANNITLSLNRSLISGYDENMDGTTGSADPEWGISVSDELQKNHIKSQYDTAIFRGSNPILGAEYNDDESSVGVIRTKYDIQDYLDKFETFAHENLSGGTIGNSTGAKATYGDPNNFKIVYADGSSQLASDVEGYGILAVNGGLSTTDSMTLDWNGLVICTDSAGTNNTNLYMGDSSSVHGAIVAGGLETENASISAEGNIRFHIINDVVVPEEPFKVTVSILGSELTSGPDAPDVRTDVSLNVGGSAENSWGGVEDCDENNTPITWSSPTTFEAYNEVEITGTFKPGYYGYYGGSYLTISSTSNSDKLIVKRDGDIAPDMEGSSGQVDVEEWLGDYINNGYISLGRNQAIYLYDYNNKEFPIWEEHDNWWINHGYHHDSNNWVWDWGTWDYVPTDEQSYEYWNYSSHRRDQFVTNNYAILPDNRDFQDLAVLLTLHPPEDVDRPVEIKYSQEALAKVRQMLQMRIPNLASKTKILEMDWDYRNPNETFDE